MTPADMLAASLYVYSAVLVAVVDGDTVDMKLDLGFRVEVQHRLRLYELDTPERGEPGYRKAASDLEILMVCPCRVHTFKDRSGGFGRYSAQVVNKHGEDVSAVMRDRYGWDRYSD